MKTALAKFATDDLLKEIERRRWENDNPDVENWCDFCVHFKPWPRNGDAPDNYNPCGLKHKTAFACPLDDYTGDRTGFYRLYCGDFKKDAPSIPPPQFMIPLHAMPAPLNSLTL